MLSATFEAALLLDHFATSTISVSRHRFVADNGRVSTMRTTSPTWALFVSSWAWNLTDRRTTFLYFRCDLITSTLTTIVLSIAAETTVPSRSWLRPRSCSGFSSRTIGLRSVAFARVGRVFLGRSDRGRRFFLGLGRTAGAGALRGLVGGVLDLCGGLDVLRDGLGGGFLDGFLGDGGLDDLLGDGVGSSFLDRPPRRRRPGDDLRDRLRDGVLDQLVGLGALLGRELARGDGVGDGFLGLYAGLEVGGDGFRRFCLDHLLGDVDLDRDLRHVLGYDVLDRRLGDFDLVHDRLDVVGDGLFDRLFGDLDLGGDLRNVLGHGVIDLGGLDGVGLR